METGYEMLLKVFIGVDADAISFYVFTQAWSSKLLMAASFSKPAVLRGICAEKSTN